MSTPCAYMNCKNKSKDISMFRFPVKDQDRLAIWIRNSGNERLILLTNEELSNRYLCAAHFPSSVINQRAERNRLIGPAIPITFDESRTIEHMPDDLPASPPLKVKTPQKFYGKRNAEAHDNETNNSPPTPKIARISGRCLFQPRQRLSKTQLIVPSTTDSFDTIKLKQLAEKFMRENNAFKARLRRLKQKKQKPKIEMYQNDIAKVIAIMQQRKKRSTKKWAKEEKNLCLSLFYKSPSAYRFLRRQSVVLAAPSTIRVWLLKSQCSPGLCPKVFNNLKKRFEHSSIKEKYCVISFDEMSIMANLEYSKKNDIIDGFEDLGRDKRTNKMAKYVLVFLARGVFSNWQIPISYYLSHTNVKAEDLQTILKSIINKLFETGLLPTAVVCDQMTTNQKVFKNLGANPKNPYFFCNGKKIYAIYDAPHLIKSVRNNLLENNYTLNGDEISFSDIRRVFEIDNKSTKSRSLTKITGKHLNPNSFQKMNVGLATQVFSHSVYAVIKTAYESRDLKSKTAISTATFIKNINNVFDSLNSRNKFSNNPNRHALSNQSTLVNQNIKLGIEIFTNLKKKLKRRINQVELMFCQQGHHVLMALFKLAKQFCNCIQNFQLKKIIVI